MCVLALAWCAHPRWRIVLAGNRDEDHARPAAPLARWDAPDHVLAGRDLAAGGTWLGVSDEGRLAVVTNVRGARVAEPARASRGALVADLLAGRSVDAIAPEAFNPFNLIVVERDRARVLANRPTLLRTDLAPGLYGLSNAALDAPWLKTVRLKAAVSAWLAGDAARPEDLLVPLRDETPLGADALSPIFIRNALYGTRCSTVVAIDQAGDGVIVERRYASDGGVAGETSLRFIWPARD